MLLSFSLPFALCVPRRRRRSCFLFLFSPFFFSSSLPLISSLPFSFCLYTALNCCGGIKNSGRLDRFEYKFLKNGTTWNAFVISQELSTLRILKARSPGNILEFFDYFFRPERILSSVILQMINKSFPGSV